MNAPHSLRQQLDSQPDGSTRFLALTGLMGGRWFRLHDIDRRSGRTRRVSLESPDATHRIFVQTDGGRWIYSFAKGELRALDVALLERQLIGARFRAPEGRASAR